MKLISQHMYKTGSKAQVVERQLQPQTYKLVIWGALASVLAACGAAPLAKKAPDLGHEPIQNPKDSQTSVPPNPEDAPSDVLIVAVPKPTAPIIANDSMGGEGVKEEKSDTDGDSAEEMQQARGPADPLRTMGNLEMATEGASTAPGGTGIASNAKGGRRGHAAAPAPIPDGSGGGNTGGTQIGAASEVRGTIDKAEIRRVVMAHAGEVKRCYEQGLTRRPDLEGRVALKFTIGKTGIVAAVTVTETTLNDRQTEQCIMRAASKWVFPKPTGDGLVTVSYPFILKSAD